MLELLGFWLTLLDLILFISVKNGCGSRLVEGGGRTLNPGEDI